MQNWNTQDYVYDTTAGKGITVYVIDSGMNLQNSDLANSANNVGGYRWLWPTKAFWKKFTARPQTEDDQGGHGSCVISKVSSFYFGVAKEASIVSLKHRYQKDDPRAIKESSILENLALVAQDVVSKKLGGKAVLNLSFGGGSGKGSKYADALEKSIANLLAKDVVVVVASGNDRVSGYLFSFQQNMRTDSEFQGKSGGSDVVNAYPALLGQKLTSMIIVGSVDVDGYQTRFSQGGPLMDVSAPGSLDGRIGVQCASGTGNTIVRSEGTSFAAPTVAGLCAYFMSIHPNLQATGGTAGRVKAFIKSTAWSRNGGPTALWNQQQSTLIGGHPKNKKRALENKELAIRDACPTGVISGFPTLGDGKNPPPAGWSPANPSDSSTSSANSTSSSTPVSVVASTSSAAKVPKTTGMLDGAPWLDPTSFCDFGTATYPTVSVASTITDSAALCAYKSLNPSDQITPKTTSAIPTDIPGVGGLPGCAAVVWGPDHQDCPYGTDGWCNCDGTLVPPLPATKTGIINCAITKQPTANNCPVNTAYSVSLAAAASSSAAAAEATLATPDATVSSFSCPTNAVVGGPDGMGPGQSNQETVGNLDGRKKLLWSNFNTWGCDMPKYQDNDAAADKLCGSIPDGTELKLGIGNQPFHLMSTSDTPDDPNCQKQFYNMGFTVKDNCRLPLTKDYCMSMYHNIVNSCELLNPDSGATWEGGLVTDNCGVAYFTSGYDVTEIAGDSNNPFVDMNAQYWWDTNHIDCGPANANDPTYCPAPLPSHKRSLGGRSRFSL